MSSGLMALCLACLVAGRGGLAASEIQGHGAEPSGEESKMAKLEGVPPEPAINPVEPKASLMIWTIMVFVLLLTVLTRFAWTPLVAALHSREQHLEHVLLETERARNESEANLAEHRKLMARAADEVRGILDKARQEAQGTAEQLVKQGDQYLAQGKIGGARLFYRQAANAGYALAAIRLGATYDPAELSRLQVEGMTADAIEARKWYERARELGAPEADEHLARLSGH